MAICRGRDTNLIFLLDLRSETLILKKLAKEVLKNFLQNENGTVTIENIQKTVANFFNIKVSDLKSNRKMRFVSLPRQIAMYLSRQLTESSFPEIGSKFGGRDHSTVIHAYNKIEKKIVNDMHLRNSVSSLKKSLEV